MTHVIPLPHYPQSADGLCLAACARMVLAYWGHVMDEETLAERLGIQPWGAPATAIQRLSRWGWQVDYGRGARVDLGRWLQQRIPVIAFVRTGFLEHWDTDVGHAVVVAGMTEEQVHIHDPIMKAPLGISLTSFEAAWTEMDYGYAIIIPAAGGK